MDFRLLLLLRIMMLTAIIRVIRIPDHVISCELFVRISPCQNDWNPCEQQIPKSVLLPLCSCDFPSLPSSDVKRVKDEHLIQRLFMASASAAVIFLAALSSFASLFFSFFDFLLVSRLSLSLFPQHFLQPSCLIISIKIHPHHDPCCCLVVPLCYILLESGFFSRYIDFL